MTLDEMIDRLQEFREQMPGDTPCVLPLADCTNSKCEDASVEVQNVVKQSNGKYRTMRDGNKIQVIKFW